KAEIEGLVERVYFARTAREALTAISVLESCDGPIILDALTAALESCHATVRIASVQALRRRQANHAGRPLAWLLRRDGSWLVRRAALEALADARGPERWHVLDAATDPHWRVRHALIRTLLRWGSSADQRREIDERLVGVESARAQGVCEYLHYRWSGRRPA